MLIAASMIIPVGLIYIHPLQIGVKGFQHCCRILRPWMRPVYLTKGVSLGLSLPGERRWRQAPLYCAGVQSGQRRSIKGRWRVEIINVLELRAMYLALRNFHSALKGRSVLDRQHLGSESYQSSGSHQVQADLMD